MQVYLRFWMVLAGLMLFENSNAQPVGSIDSFQSPVNFPIILSANFGEIRSDHFHSGIDIKTQGAGGKHIYAVEEGYVSRISVSPGGFGKAIYLTHPNGLVTVYGHLNRFTDAIEDYVTENQYRQKVFQINLFPENDRFPVRKGELIGLSGNTGSSLGPHLHFEVRDSKTEYPLNPLLYNLNIRDTIEPVIYNIYLYPLTGKSHVEFQTSKKQFPVNSINGDYSLKNKDSIAVGGLIGIGVETNDFLNAARNRCGVFSIEVKVDQVPVFLNEMTEFSFNETRYINSHIDYEEKIRNKKNIHRTFVDPNNQLSIYRILNNRGKLDFTDNNPHEISVIVKDAYKNSSELIFTLVSSWGPGTDIKEKERVYSRVMPFDISNRYEHNGFRIVIPDHSLYDTLFFTYAKSPGKEGIYSEIHHVHNRFTPVHKNFTMYIKPDTFPEGIESKLLVAKLDEEGDFSAIGGEYSDGFVKVRTRSFGKFTIIADTIPPEIKPVTQIQDRDLSGKRQIKFRISDDISGIRSFNGFIDNQWVLFQYDPKNESLFYSFDDARLVKGKEHELVLTVIDNRENISVFNASFFW